MAGKPSGLSFGHGTVSEIRKKSRGFIRFGEQESVGGFQSRKVIAVDVRDDDGGVETKTFLAGPQAFDACLKFCGREIVCGTEWCLHVKIS